MLVKPLKLVAHITFFYLPANFTRFCRSLYPKYRAKVHFNRDAHSYCTKLDFLSLDEVAMKEEIHSWFDILSYEESFSPEEVPHTEARKRQIDTYAIVSTITQEESKTIFGESKV